MATKKSDETTEAPVEARTAASEDPVFQDIEGDLEQAQQDAEKAAAVAADPDSDEVVTSEASATVQDELAHRAAASAEGGGPWPQDLLVERYVGGTKLTRSVGEYTSHEDAEEKK